MIRADELMIGDIVTVNRSECVADGGQYATWKQDGRIIMLEKDFVRVQYKADKGDDWEDWEEVSPDDFEPIPITHEILERNGFRLKEEDDSHKEYIAGDELCIIVFYFYKETIYGVSTLLECERGFAGGLDRIHKCNLLYVHQLQHALKLCGIPKTIEL